MSGPSLNRRSRLVILAIAVLSVVALQLPVFANLAGSTFDANDGNLVVNGVETDWANAPNLQKGLDKPTGQTDDSFGQGTKEDTAVPTVIDGSIPNNKSDLTRFYVANEKASGDDFLYLAWERVQEPSGTTNMDFEFNQDSTLSSNGVTPVRTAGDVLIKYDLSQGGTHPTLGYHLWVTSGPASQCESSNKVPCWDKVHALSGANFEGAINDPTNNPPTGSVIDPIQPNAPRTLSPRTFGEAAINLTDSGILPTGSCKTFGAAYLKSRSSDSFTAAVKDFIAPIPVDITNCGSVDIHKTDDSNPAVPLEGAVFTLYNDNAPVGGSRGPEDTATTMTCTTDASGDCDTITNVGFGDYWAVETTGVPGYDKAPDQSFTLDASTPNLTISLTFVDPRQKGAIKVIKNAKDKRCSGANAPAGCSSGKAPLAGAGFEIWQESNGDPGLQTTGGTPDTKVADEQLTALSGSGSSTVASTCFAGLFFGDYYVHESTAPTGYNAADDQTATVAAKSTCANTTVSKTFTDTPLTDLTVTATSQNPGRTKSSIECVDANGDDINGSPVALSDPAQLDSKNLEPGTYTCTVVIDP